MNDKLLFDGCLLLCDVDGTLIYDGIIPPRNIEKINDFIQQGGMVSLATGRSVAAAEMIISRLGAVSPSVVSNGGVIFDFQSKKPLKSWNLSEESHAFAKMILDTHPEFGIEIHLPDQVYLLNKSEEVLLHEEYECFTAKDIDWDSVNCMDWNKVLFALNCEQEVDVIQKLSQPYWTEETIFVQTKAPFGVREHFYFEQVPAGISKGTAAKELCKILSVPKGCCFAIGDYYNDLEMIKSADVSATTSEAPDDIKLQTDYVTGSMRNGAVADFIDYLKKCRKGCNE